VGTVPLTDVVSCLSHCENVVRRLTEVRPIVNKAIVDIRPPALCNPTAPFAADRPHYLRPEIVGILFALAWHAE